MITDRVSDAKNCSRNIEAELLATHKPNVC